MPAKSIRFLLTLSSIAPIGFVLMAGLLWTGQLTWFYVVVFGGPMLLLAVTAWLVCIWAVKRVPSDVLAVDEIKSADRDALGFLLAYALPIVAIKNVQDLQNFNGGALAAFAVLASIVIYKLNLMHVNPLLGLAGFHFYEVLAKSGRTYLYVGRALGSGGDELRVRWLSADICLEARDERTA
jgi:hypothetical protein